MTTPTPDVHVSYERIRGDWLIVSVEAEVAGDFRYWDFDAANLIDLRRQMERQRDMPYDVRAAALHKCAMAAEGLS